MQLLVTTGRITAVDIAATWQHDGNIVPAQRDLIQQLHQTSDTAN